MSCRAGLALAYLLLASGSFTMATAQQPTTTGAQDPTKPRTQVWKNMDRNDNHESVAKKK